MEKNRQVEACVVDDCRVVLHCSKEMLTKLDLKSKNKTIQKHIKTVLWNNPYILRKKRRLY